MRRKKRKTGLTTKLSLAFVSICVFGFTGVSYAYWTDSVQANINISTGKLDVGFEGDTLNENSGKEFKVSISDDKQTANVTINQNNNNQKDSNKQNDSNKQKEDIKQICVYVKNTGTMPIQLSQIINTKDDIKVSSSTMEPNVIEQGKEGKLTINFDGKIKKGASIEIHFTQFNCVKYTSGYWNKILTLKFN